jgi:hypothetical protein
MSDAAWYAFVVQRGGYLLGPFVAITLIALLIALWDFALLILGGVLAAAVLFVIWKRVRR